MLYSVVARCFTLRSSPLSEIAFVLVRFDHVASRIVNANHSIMWPAVKTQRGQFTYRSISSESVAVNPRSTVRWVIAITIMPLEPPDQQYWQAAVGYVELGMFAEADSELDKIDPFCRALPEVLAVRLAIYRGLKKWELMQQVAKRLKEFEPDNVQWTISLAYATRRAYSIDVAMEILIDAEAKFPREAAIPYNLACYHCQRGEIENAKRYLRQAFEIDPNWRKAALEDEDLKPLWDLL